MDVESLRGAAVAPARPARGWRALALPTAIDLALAAAIVVGFSFLLAMLVAIARTLDPDWGGAGVAALGGLPAVFIPLSLIGSLLAGLALWALRRRGLPAAPRRWSPALAAATLALALGLQLAALGFTALTELLGVSSAGSNLALILAAYAAAPWLTVLGAVLLAPIGEELVFRRILLHRFAQSGRPWLGLVVTSLLFALMHEPWPGERALLGWLLTLATYGAIGGGLGLLYLRSGRFDAVLLAHVLINAIGVALLLGAAGP